MKKIMTKSASKTDSTGSKKKVVKDASDESKYKSPIE
jgi:hypothetical protein